MVVVRTIGWPIVYHLMYSDTAEDAGVFMMRSFLNTLKIIAMMATIMLIMHQPMSIKFVP